MLKRRIAITGLGALTGAGEGALPLWQSAVEGRSAIGTLSFSANGNGWHPAGAEIRDFIPEKFVTQRKALKVMARDIQLAVAAASLAIDDAKLRTVSVPRERMGLIVGSGVLNHELDELAYSIQSSVSDKGLLDLKKFGTDGISALFPLWLLKYLPNMPACHISILFDLQGPNNTMTTGASSALQAIGEAVRIIERGAADLMLAGGAESKTNPLGLSQYQVMGVLSDSYKPFDKDAKGFVIGEGAGFIVLEEWEHAKKRGAKIYAEVTGFGASSSKGRFEAMDSALAESGILAKELSYIQSSGVGIPEEDRLELEAIEALTKTGPAVALTNSKPVTGFTGFAAGVLDVIVSTLALEHQIIPPMLNLKNLRGASGAQWILDRSGKKEIRYVLTNAFGLGSPCASLVTKRFEGK